LKGTTYFATCASILIMNIVLGLPGDCFNPRMRPCQAEWIIFDLLNDKSTTLVTSPTIVDIANVID
jgi:hypothetical protein